MVRVPVAAAMRTSEVPTVPISGTSALTLVVATMDTNAAAAMARVRNFMCVLLYGVSTNPAWAPRRPVNNPSDLPGSSLYQRTGTLVFGEDRLQSLRRPETSPHHRREGRHRDYGDQRRAAELLVEQGTHCRIGGCGPKRAAFDQEASQSGQRRSQKDQREDQRDPHQRQTLPHRPRDPQDSHAQHRQRKAPSRNPQVPNRQSRAPGLQGKTCSPTFTSGTRIRNRATATRTWPTGRATSYLIRTLPSGGRHVALSVSKTCARNWSPEGES